MLLVMSQLIPFGTLVTILELSTTTKQFTKGQLPH